MTKQDLIYRCLSLETELDADKRALLENKLNARDGIVEYTIYDTSLKVRYDLQQFTYHDLVTILDKTDITCLYGMKESFIDYIEQNRRFHLSQYESWEKDMQQVYAACYDSFGQRTQYIKTDPHE